MRKTYSCPIRNLQLRHQRQHRWVILATIRVNPGQVSLSVTGIKTTGRLRTIGSKPDKETGEENSSLVSKLEIRRL